MRLDRYLTLCDLGTRKQVKELISKGRISIDGKTVKDAGAAVKGEVKLDGKAVSYRPIVAIVMNKPAGILTATTDRKQGTVLDLLPESDRRREPAPRRASSQSIHRKPTSWRQVSSPWRMHSLSSEISATLTRQHITTISAVPR